MLTLFFFECQDSPHPEDEGRRFILSYFLSDEMISIFEKPTRNSGIIGGKFLEKTSIPKPGSTVENPEYYSPADFAIGATVEGNNFYLIYDWPQNMCIGLKSNNQLKH